MAKFKKDELGKGLRALISNIEPSTQDQEPNDIAIVNTIAELPIDKIEANPLQPRTEFNQEELLELVQSIKANGLIQPITVRKLTDQAFQIISGERRFRACKLAGLKSIPCYIRLIKDEALLELALIENIQRADLNPIEIAISYQRLIDELNYSQEEMALRVGKKRSTITNFLRILKLSPDIQKALKAKSISMGHAKALLSIEDPSLRNVIFHQIINEGLSVRATENLGKKNKKVKPTQDEQQKGDTIEIQLKHIQDKLSSRLGTKVKIKRSASGAGKFIIPFQNDDMLNQLIEILE